MIISKNAIKIKNNEHISKQIAEKQFNDEYGDEYKDTELWGTFKKKYIKEWTLKYLSIEDFYDEDLINFDVIP